MATCLHCGRECRLTDGREIYPHREDIAARAFWSCISCPNTHVGCHPDTTKPLGRAANAETRKARSILHQQMLDPLWRDAGAGRNKARSAVYRYLGEEMGLSEDDTHVGMWDVERCRTAWRILKGKTAAEFQIVRSPANKYCQPIGSVY